MTELADAMARAKVSDYSAGTMSRAMQDRRVLTSEVERLHDQLGWLEDHCRRLVSRLRSEADARVADCDRWTHELDTGTALEPRRRGVKSDLPGNGKANVVIKELRRKLSAIRMWANLSDDDTHPIEALSHIERLCNEAAKVG